MIPELPIPTPTPHADHGECADPHECLVEALTRQADWVVLDRQLTRCQRSEGQEFHFSDTATGCGAG